MTDSQLSQPRPGSQCSSSRLWEKALAQLEPDVRACLEQGARSGGRRDVVAALLKTVAEKRKLCIRRQYKLRMPGGRVVILRDVLEKMARWLDRFKGAVDAAVQYDPAHAALPWAVVRFILQIALDEIQAHGSILEALEAFTRIMARCARVEELHLRKAGAATMSAALEEALTRLYAAILGSLATALKYFDKSHAGRLFAVIIEHSALQNLENEEQGVLKVVSLIDSETIQELDKQVHRVMDTSTMVQTSMDKTRTSECLTWLSSTRVHDHHRSVSAAKIPSSCAWLFKQDMYRTWLEDSCSSLLVLHGIRGCGKSVLMSAVVDSLREPAAAAATTRLGVPCAFFYCADSTNEPDRAAPDAILRSIIRQLAVVAVDASTCTIDEKLWTLYRKKMDAAQPDKMNLQVLDVEECCSLLLEMTLTNPAYLVIDAVDELSETARALLLRVIHRVLSASGSLVKILISSRDNTHTEALLPAQTFKIRVSARLNDGDMTAFIHGQMDEAVASARLLNGNLDPETKEKLTLALKDGAREMFQWVVLQINFLCTRTSKQDVIAAIEAGLVATLDQLYADAFRALLTRGSFSRDVALCVFSWLLYGNVTLSGEAMLCAVSKKLEAREASQMTASDLVRMCQHLVVYDMQLGAYRFCHPSAADFLRQQPELAASRAHGILAAACLHQCIAGEADTPCTWTDGPLGDFHSYAALNWWDHVRKHDGSSCPQNTTDSIMFEFVFDGNEPDVSLAFYLWLNWIRLYAEALPVYHTQKRLFGALWSTECQPIFTACQFGLTALMNRYLETTPDVNVNITNALGHTGFYLAAAGGHVEIVRILHERNSNVHVRCGWLGSPLQAACFHGHLETARILLELGASARAAAKFSNAFEAACRGDRPEVAQMLLAHGAVVETNEDYEAAIRWSSEVGMEEVVDQLLKLCPSVANQATRMATAAIKRGSTVNLKRLLIMSPNVDKVVPKDGIAIASYYGHVEMMKYLRELGLSLHVEGPYGSPLRSACLAGHEAVARLLISWGISVDIGGEKGHAIQAAAMQGHSRLVLLLISEDVDVNIGSRHGPGGRDPLGTPLEAASYYGHEAVVDVLLKAGASSGIGGYFNDAMHAAIEGSQTNIALRLLRAGYRVTSSLFGTGPMASMTLPSPKSIANMAAEKARRRHASPYDAESYEWLLGDYEYVLQQCAVKGNTAVANAFVEEVRSAGHHTMNLLWTLGNSLPIAASNGHLDMVKVLMAHWTLSASAADAQLEQVPCDIFEATSDALIEAASNGHSQVVEFLSVKMREVALPIEPGRREQWRPLRLATTTLPGAFSKASKNQHIDTVERLWSHVVEWGDFAPLEQLVGIVVRFGSQDILRLFLNERAEALSVERRNKALKTAIITAANASSLHFTEIILSHAKGCKDIDQLSIALAGYISACKHGNQQVALMCLQEFHGKSLSNDQKLSGWIVAAMEKRDETLAALFPTIMWTGAGELERGLAQDAFVAAAANGCIDAAQMVFIHALKDQAEDVQGAVLARGLMAACFRLDRDGVNLCIQLGADVNSKVPMPSKVCQRYAAFIDFEDDIWGPGQSAVDRYMKGEQRLSSDYFTSTQAVLGQRYRDARIWPSTKFNVCNTFLRTFNESAALSHTYVQSPNRFSTDEESPWSTYKSGDDDASILQILLDSGVSLEPSGLHKPMKDVQALLLYSLPYWARVDTFFATEWTAQTASEAFDHGVKDLILQLFERRPGLRAQGREFSMWLFVAAAAGDGAILDILIARGVDVNSLAAASTALNAAARTGQLSAVKKLCAAGATMVYDEESMVRVVADGHTDVFDYLQEKGLQVDWLEGRACLVCKAMGCGSMSMMRRLVETTSQLHDHTVAFIKACRGSDSDKATQMIGYLMEKKANVRINGIDREPYSSFSTSPLIAACGASNLELAKLLLTHGADVGIVVQHGSQYSELDVYASTPLIVAAGLGNLELLRLLLERGADPNQECPQHNGRYCITPLLQACCKGRDAVVRELLSLEALEVDSTRLSAALVKAMYARRGARQTLETLLKWHFRRGVDEDVLRKAIDAVPKGRAELVDVVLEYSPSDVLGSNMGESD